MMRTLPQQRFSHFAIHQVRQPEGLPSASDFNLVQESIPALNENQALVENIYLSVDPYMRECMDGVWQLHQPLEGRSIGRVVQSLNPQLPVGQLVFHRKGWRTHAVIQPKEARLLHPILGVPLSAYLGLLGGTGLTAYVALAKIACLQQGESIFISAAAGGVGSAAIQIARLLGAGHIVGSAGSAPKVNQLINVLGCHAAFNYRDGPIHESLARAAPDGLDVYIDNVGGTHLEAAIGSMRNHGRIAWVGAIGQYNTAQTPSAPRNLYDIVDKSLRLEGILVRNYNHLQDEFEQFLAPHLRSGTMVSYQTVVRGFDSTIDAFIGMLSGTNLGKMIVQVAEE